MVFPKIMPLSLQRKKRLLAVATSVISLAGYWLSWPWPFAELRGKVAARIDLGIGSYKVLAIGLRAPWRNEYARLLHERYGIRVQTEAFCVVSHSLVAYITGYNTVSEASTIRKVGHDPFQECYEDAKRDWEQRRAKLGFKPTAVTKPDAPNTSRQDSERMRL